MQKCPKRTVLHGGHNCIWQIASGGQTTRQGALLGDILLITQCTFVICHSCVGSSLKINRNNGSLSFTGYWGLHFIRILTRSQFSVRLHFRKFQTFVRSNLSFRSHRTSNHHRNQSIIVHVITLSKFRNQTYIMHALIFPGKNCSKKVYQHEDTQTRIQGQNGKMEQNGTSTICVTPTKKTSKCAVNGDAKW